MQSLTFSLLLGVLIAPILLPLSLGAQESPVATGDASAVAENSADRVGIAGHELAENIRGRQVVNAIGEEVGEITSIIISGDRVSHAIISIGGFVGPGGSDVVVPSGILSFDDEQTTIETLASADQIEELTLFEPQDFGLSQ